jgi:hypothetical protein
MTRLPPARTGGQGKLMGGYHEQAEQAELPWGSDIPA